MQSSYRSSDFHHHHHHHHNHLNHNSTSSKLDRLASENAVVVFSLSSCCMCHVVSRLLCSLGVSPTIHEVDGDEELQHALVSLNPVMESEDCALHGCPPSSSSSSRLNVPAIFVGGKFLGGLDEVMASHINGSLVPLLREAGALWL